MLSSTDLFILDFIHEWFLLLIYQASSFIMMTVDFTDAEGFTASLASKCMGDWKKKIEIHKGLECSFYWIWIFAIYLWWFKYHKQTIITRGSDCTANNFGMSWRNVMNLFAHFICYISNSAWFLEFIM